MSQAGLGYSVLKIFLVLLFLTALEVAWGMFFRDPRWFLWGGLLVCALFKGALILMYFMHMKYEKIIVWSLVVPTVPLVGVIVFTLMPDVSFKDDVRDHPVGYMLNEDGKVVEMTELGTAGHGENQH